MENAKLMEHMNTNIMCEIARERCRQVDEGYDAAHDDGHTDGSIAKAAAAYAIAGSGPGEWLVGELTYPWHRRSFDNLKSCRESLIVAAALCIAEIERRDRQEAQCQK